MSLKQKFNYWTICYLEVPFVYLKAVVVKAMRVHLIR